VPCVIAATQIDLWDDDDGPSAVADLEKEKTMITTAQGEKLEKDKLRLA
jgi:hypothetical protein